MVTFVGCTVGFSFNIGNRYEAKNTLQKEKNFLFEVFLKMGLSLVSHEAELAVSLNDLIVYQTLTLMK